MALAPHDRLQQRRRKRPLFLLLLVLSVAALLFWRVNPLPEQESEPSGKERMPAGAETVARKNIFDRRYRPLAVSVELVSVYAQPRRVKLDRGQLTYLAAVLRQDPNMLKKNLGTQTSIAWLARDLRADAAPELARLNLPGIHPVREFRRFYPAGSAAAHVSGFYHDGHGIAGLEYAYDRLQVERIPGVLPGDDGATESVRPVDSQLIAAVDLDLQGRLVEDLGGAMAKSKASGGCALLLDGATGEVLAMASLPAFDPNRIGRTDSASLPNRVMSLSLDSGLLGRLAGFLRGAGEPAPTPAPTQAPAQASEPVPGFWQPAGGDMFLSRELAALPAGEEPPPQWLREAAEATLFASSFDQQTGRVGGLSPIGLGNALTALINGGSWLTPHLLLASYGKEFRRIRYAVHAPAAETGVEGVELPFKDGVFIAEALRGLPSLEEGDDGGAAKKRSAPTLMRQAVLLGATENKRVVVIVLENPEIAMEQTSPLRNVAARLLELADRVGPFAPPAPESLLVDNREMFARWREESGVESFAAVASQETVMPAVTGFSLRKALRTLQPLGLQCTVRGSGAVVAQEPKAGAPLKSPACQLRLESGGL
ncbi:MAG: PASTA domain-containing protein [Thermodesulfobacteriota bacterium]